MAGNPEINSNETQAFDFCASCPLRLIEDQAVVGQAIMTILQFDFKQSPSKIWESSADLDNTKYADFAMISVCIRKRYHKACDSRFI